MPMRGSSGGAHDRCKHRQGFREEPQCVRATWPVAGDSLISSNGMLTLLCLKQVQGAYRQSSKVASVRVAIVVPPPSQSGAKWESIVFRRLVRESSPLASGQLQSKRRRLDRRPERNRNGSGPGERWKIFGQSSAEDCDWPGSAVCATYASQFRCLTCTARNRRRVRATL